MVKSTAQLNSIKKSDYEVESMLNLGLDVDQLLFNIDSTLVFHRCNCNVVSTLNLDYVEMLTLDQC